MNGLTISSIGINSDLDLATTVLSALGTAFTPIGTVHALTAATTITSGFKSNLNSDIFAQATIANYAQAIQSTYYADMNNYITALEKVDDSTLVVPIEIAKIRPIHKECSLAAAQATIHATLTPKETATSPSSTTITVKAVVAGKTYAVSASSDSPKLTLSTTPYTAKTADKTGDVAAKLFLAIEAATGFSSSGAVATPSGDSIKITGGNLTWKSTGTGDLQITNTLATTASTPETKPTSTAPTTGGVTPTTVPGRSLR